MDYNDLELVSQSGVAKYTLCKTQPSRYITRAVLAGLYLALATIASNVCGALFSDSSPAIGKVIAAAVFGVGLICIVLLGGELFTGNNFVLSISALERRVPLSGVARVWVMSYLGNLIGSIVLCTLFAWSGGMGAILAPYLATATEAKLALTIPQLLLRGVLCNFVVCMAVLSGIKVKDSTTKILMIGMLIFTFVISGLEHSVVNMSLFTLSLWMVPGASFAAILRNLLWVTVGNILGGGVLLALPFHYACGSRPPDAP